MAAIQITDGIAEVNSKAEWEACTVTPEGAVDTTTTAGSVKLAGGFNAAAIVTPIYEFTPWERWLFITLAGTREPMTAYYIRFRTATTEAGIAGATWSPYLDSIAADGSIGLNLRSFVLNNPAWAVGPFIQLEVQIER